MRVIQQILTAAKSIKSGTMLYIITVIPLNKYLPSWSIGAVDVADCITASPGLALLFFGLLGSSDPLSKAN